MSKPRNGNRKCPNCKHFFAAHGYEIGTYRRPCFAGAKRDEYGEILIQRCLCMSLKKDGAFTHEY
jgi:REP element-mobilizing transposase RayT